MPADKSKPVTPSNPSFKATKRVKNPLPVPTTCNVCNENTITCCTNDVIYQGRKYGDWPWIYLCTSCRSYVGLHPFTNIPLGTLATYEVRNARTTTKGLLYKLMSAKKLNRTQAYQKLADTMGIPVSECHFGWFDVDQCQQAREALEQLMTGYNPNSPFSILKKALTPKR